MRGRSGGMRHVLGLLVVLVLACPALAAAQRVQLEGAADVAVDRRLSRLLASGQYLLVTSDTVVPSDDTIPESVLVLDATLILEGTVEGDLVVVGGGVFVRPHGRVSGDLVNVGGGAYHHPQARIGGHIVSLPDAPYHVVRTDGVLRIVARAHRSLLSLDGKALGLHVPTYDRVDGLTAAWGASLALPLLGPLQPRLHGWIGYRTQRGEPAGGADLGLRAGPYELRGGVERASYTNDGWIRLGGLNSLGYLWNGNDYRNYYAADRVFATLTRELGDVEKRFHAALRIGAQLEDATSVQGDDPWHVVGSTPRPNPPVDDGRIASALASLEGDWTGSRMKLGVGGQLEFARLREGGQFRFDRYDIWGGLAMQAIAHNTLELRWRFMGPLPGTDSLPRQRWGILGGAGTLPVFDVATFRGDRLAFVRTRYLVPLPHWLTLPVLRVPSLELIHVAGRAWTASSAQTRLEQNIGAGLEFFGAYIEYIVDVRDTHRGVLTGGLFWPYGNRPSWERR